MLATDGPMRSIMLSSDGGDYEDRGESALEGTRGSKKRKFEKVELDGYLDELIIVPQGLERR